MSEMATKTGLSGSDTALLDDILGDIKTMSEECSETASSIGTFISENAEAFKGDGSKELTDLFEAVKAFTSKMQTDFFDGSMTTLVNELKEATDNAAGNILKVVGAAG